MAFHDYPITSATRGQPILAEAVNGARTLQTAATPYRGADRANAVVGKSRR